MKLYFSLDNNHIIKGESDCKSISYDFKGKINNKDFAYYSCYNIRIKKIYKNSGETVKQIDIKKIGILRKNIILNFKYLASLKLIFCKFVHLTFNAVLIKKSIMINGYKYIIQYDGALMGLEYFHDGYNFFFRSKDPINKDIIIDSNKYILILSNDNEEYKYENKYENDEITFFYCLKSKDKIYSLLCYYYKYNIIIENSITDFIIDPDKISNLKLSEAKDPNYSDDNFYKAYNRKFKITYSIKNGKVKKDEIYQKPVVRNFLKYERELRVDILAKETYMKEKRNIMFKNLYNACLLLYNKKLI